MDDLFKSNGVGNTYKSPLFKSLDGVDGHVTGDKNFEVERGLNETIKLRYKENR